MNPAHPIHGTLRSYALSELPELAARFIEAHVMSCPACRARVMDVQAELVSQIEALPALGELPPYGQRPTPDRAQPPSRRWRPFVREAEPQTAQQQLAHWLAQPGLRLLALQDSEQQPAGQALLLPSREVLFVLIAPAPGKCYQAWGADSAQQAEPLIPLSSGSGLLTARLGNSNYICLSLEDKRRDIRNQTTARAGAGLGAGGY